MFVVPALAGPVAHPGDSENIGRGPAEAGTTNGRACGFGRGLRVDRLARATIGDRRLCGGSRRGSGPLSFAAYHTTTKVVSNCNENWHGRVREPSRRARERRSAGDSECAETGTTVAKAEMRHGLPRSARRFLLVCAGRGRTAIQPRAARSWAHGSAVTWRGGTDRAAGVRKRSFWNGAGVLWAEGDGRYMDLAWTIMDMPGHFCEGLSD